MSATLTKKCKYCGKEFKTFKSINKTYCNLVCFRMSQVNLKETKECIVCGTKFLTHKCKKQICCSEKCKFIRHSRLLSKQEERECLFCKTKFLVTKKSKQKFCSFDCHHLFLEKERGTCKICGKPKPSGRRTYCSKKCMAIDYSTILIGRNNPNWKENTSNRQNGVPTFIRNNILKRDNYTCQKCKTKDWDQSPSLLHIHHLLPISEGGSDDYDNLVTLCFVCHWRDMHGFNLNENLQQIASEQSCGI